VRPRHGVSTRNAPGSETKPLKLHDTIEHDTIEHDTIEHDTIEDVGVTRAVPVQRFGSDAADLVMEVMDDKIAAQGGQKRAQVQYSEG
jgi:hypothetical protein